MVQTLWRIEFSREEMEILIKLFENEDDIHPIQDKYLELYNYLKSEME